MGIIKARQINVELATVDALSKSLQDAHKTSGDMLDYVSAAARGLAQDAIKYESVIKEGQATLQKAKDIGADSVIKDVTEIIQVAQRNATLCKSRQAKLEAIFQMK